MVRNVIKTYIGIPQNYHFAKFPTENFATPLLWEHNYFDCILKVVN